MSWYDKVKAYEEVTDETCVTRTGPEPIPCRWRDINIGDSERVEVRCRPVAREIKQKAADSHFALAPPLAVARYVMNRAATYRRLLALGAKRAFLPADPLTETYVKPQHVRDIGRCWLLKRCMHGTSCRSRMAWFRESVPTLHAQLEQLSMYIRACITRIGYGCAW